MHEKKQEPVALVVRPMRGMDQRWKPSPNAAATVRDMRWDLRDGWRDAGGYRTLTQDYTNEAQPPAVVNSYDSEARITSLHWWAQHNGGVQWLLYTTATGRWSYFNGSLAPSANHRDIYFVDGTLFDGSARSVASVNGVWWGPQYQAWGNWIYMVDQSGGAYVFNGRYADRAGFSSGPRAPDVFAANKNPGSTAWQTTDTQKGLGAAGKTCGYRYKMSYLNERGQESPLSEASELVQWANAASRHAYITTVLPIGDDSVVARRLYRTQDILDDLGEPLTRSGGENYFYHSTIPDNVTTIYMDVKPDAMLGDAVDELDFGPWPSSVTLLAEFKGTLFMATNTDSGVFYSAPGMPENVPPGNYFPLTSGTSGPPTVLRATKNALVVYKERAIWLIKGDPANGFYAQCLTSDQGASSPNAVRELPGMGLVSVGLSGVNLLEGALENTGTPTNIVNLGTQIQDEIERWNISALANAKACVYHRDHELWISVPTVGEVYPTRVLVYHWLIGSWSYRENYPIGGIVETGDHRGYLIFGSWDVTNVPGLHIYSPGWTNKGGVWNVEPAYVTTHVDFGSLWRGVMLHRVGIYCVGYGENDIRTRFTVNRKMQPSIDATVTESGAAWLTHDQMYPVDDEARDSANSAIYLVPRYGSAVWGGGATATTWKWAEHRPVSLWWSATGMHQDPLLELQVEFTPASRRIQVLGWELEVTGQQRRILPLTDNFGGGSV